MILPLDCLWHPGPEHDASPRAVARRIATGEESERAYEARREARRELKDEPTPDTNDEGES